MSSQFYATDINNATMAKVVLNPVLTYMRNGINKACHDLVHSACCSFYSLDELIKAKEALWENGNEDLLGTNFKRRDSVKGREKEKVVFDLIEGINKLDAANCSPVFAVDAMQLDRIPKASPEEALPISLCARMNEVESALHEIKSLFDRVTKLEKLENRPLPQNKASPCMYSAAVASPVPAAISREMNSTAPSVATKPIVRVVSHTQELANQASHNDPKDGYTQVRHRKHPRKRRVLVGTGVSNELRGAPEPSRDIFVSRLLKDTENTHVTEHLQKKGVVPRAVVKISHDKAQFNSFRIELKLSDVRKVLQDTFWPDGIHVRRFYQKRQQQQQPLDSSSQSSDDEQTRLKEVDDKYDG